MASPTIERIGWSAVLALAENERLVTCFTTFKSTFANLEANTWIALVTSLTPHMYLTTPKPCTGHLIMVLVWPTNTLIFTLLGLLDGRTHTNLFLEEHYTTTLPMKLGLV
jgi:hypothetical protein